MTKQLTATETGIQSEVALFPVGQVGFDIYGREWMYCRAEGAITAGYLCTVTTDGAYDATIATTTTLGTPGTHWKIVGWSDIDVTDEYHFWLFVGGGQFEAWIEASFTAADVIYSTATAGVIGADDTSFQIDGVKVVDSTTDAARATIWVAERARVGVVEAHD